MQSIIDFVLPVLAVAALSVGWLLVQYLAKRLGTKNHFDHPVESCGRCNCGNICERRIGPNPDSGL